MEASVSMAKPVLQVDTLRVNYGLRTVLKGLDLSIGSGEIFGLLGPNGAGKTTLVRSICGRVRPASGNILIKGRACRDRQALRQIGLVPQEIALYQHMTARENLMTFGRLSGLSRKQTTEAMAFAIEASRLAEQVDDYVHTLSGGWKRRVNIAAAILHRPSLLILDEPTVGVDIDARNALHEVISDLSHTGLAVLLATHDLDQAQTLCGRVGFLRDGLLSPVGKPVELLQRAFGKRREVVLQLREPAPPEISNILSELGFTDHTKGLERRGLVEATPEQQAHLTEVLHQSDLNLKEIRFREPGLDSLFLQMTDAETAK